MRPAPISYSKAAPSHGPASSGTSHRHGKNPVPGTPRAVVAVPQAPHEEDAERWDGMS